MKILKSIPVEIVFDISISQKIAEIDWEEEFKKCIGTLSAKPNNLSPSEKLTTLNTLADCSDLSAIPALIPLVPFVKL